jgi:hypothetical protein
MPPTRTLAAAVAVLLLVAGPAAVQAATHPDGPGEEPEPEHRTPAAGPRPTVGPTSGPGLGSPILGSAGGANAPDPAPIPGEQGAVVAGVGLVAGLGLGAALARPRRPSSEDAATEGVRFEVVGRRADASPDRAVDGDDPLEHPGAEGAHLLARRAARDGRLRLSEAWLDASLRLDPDQRDVRVDLASVLDARGKPAPAAELLERVVEQAPTDLRARLLLARTRARDGRPGEGVRALEPLAGHGDDLDARLREDDRLAPLRDDPRFRALFGAT